MKHANSQMLLEISMHVTTWVQRDVSGHWPHQTPTCVLGGGSFLESANRNVKPHRAAVFLTWTLVQVQNKITSTPKKIWLSQQHCQRQSQEQRARTNTRYHQHSGYSPGPAIPKHSNITSANIRRTMILSLVEYLSFLHSFCCMPYNLYMYWIIHGYDY